MVFMDLLMVMVIIIIKVIVHNISLNLTAVHMGSLRQVNLVIARTLHLVIIMVIMMTHNMYHTTNSF